MFSFFCPLSFLSCVSPSFHSHLLSTCLLPPIAFPSLIQLSARRSSMHQSCLRVCSIWRTGTILRPYRISARRSAKRRPSLTSSSSTFLPCRVRNRCPTLLHTQGSIPTDSISSHSALIAIIFRDLSWEVWDHACIKGHITVRQKRVISSPPLLSPPPSPPSYRRLTRSLRSILFSAFWRQMGQ